ncbi:copper-binding protein [Pseudomonas sp. 2FG]|uniref:copper-binding protein n=1 Tax=Pseudomonas sp. 2FG TaxID=2502191 RepID=UPI0010F511F5|nr:copper-binding protein [Pseudomonas sp. 2FG]
MRKTLVAAASAVVALSLPVQAEDMPGMKMDGMPMVFTTTAEHLEGLKMGDRVAFGFRAEGVNAMIASIKAVK